MHERRPIARPTSDDQIELYVSAGTDFLEVENLGGTGTYSLTTSLSPSAAPLQPIPINPDGSEPDAIVAGDFNGDGRTDLAVANNISNDVSILLGNGDGTFQSPVTYAVGSLQGPRGGRLQRRRPHRPGRRQQISNDVSSCWATATAPSRTRSLTRWGPIPVALVAGDFNGDGRTDLAVANNISNDVSILLGNGDGTFQNQATYAVGSSPDALVAGDFNGDGRTDLAVANYGDKRRVDPPGQRRRHLPEPGHLRGGDRSKSHRDG